MKLSALFIFSLALLSFASLAEAVCDEHGCCEENGCCYCDKVALLLTHEGMSTDNCQPGFYCLCEWGFGTCTAVTDNDAGGFDAAVSMLLDEINGK